MKTKDVEDSSSLQYLTIHFVIIPVFLIYFVVNKPKLPQEKKSIAKEWEFKEGILPQVQILFLTALSKHTFSNSFNQTDMNNKQLEHVIIRYTQIDVNYSSLDLAFDW